MEYTVTQIFICISVLTIKYDFRVRFSMSFVYAVGVGSGMCSVLWLVHVFLMWVYGVHVFLMWHSGFPLRKKRHSS